MIRNDATKKSRVKFCFLRMKSATEKSARIFPFLFPFSIFYI